MSTAFESVRIGRWDLPQRFVMAPLTRNRAGEGQAPHDLNAEYYGQRAGAGLIITEGTQPSAVGQGYLDTPGMHTDEQVAGWRPVADAVHAGGGRIVVQLMHAGRIAHPDNKAGLETRRAERHRRARRDRHRRRASRSYAVPRALETDEIPARRGGVRPRRPHRPSRPGSTASRSTPPTATCCTSSSRRRATAHRRLRRLAREPRPLRPSRSRRPSPRRSAPTGSASASRPRTTSRASSRRTRPRRPTTYEPLVEAHRARSASPTSASSATRRRPRPRPAQALRRPGHRQHRLRQGHRAAPTSRTSSSATSVTSSPWGASSSPTRTSSSRWREGAAAQRAELRHLLRRRRRGLHGLPRPPLTPHRPPRSHRRVSAR